ncbi:hypothetical protein DTO027B5_4792 [Paecilomyces variotii]|nr:hypothetical protein DTO169C6_7349 [Paecilomyces variotii]KAJ9322693.1 hypothetical protein DTO027B3_6275 [Paecilomyces variotii]KAJ9333422.1 hypothetical protein DTO027B5_4792 [Paecilomyces variotii]KAJ9397641.1 hypothetical protein DTO282F9_5467 [Paecilomyces variotii]
MTSTEPERTESTTTTTTNAITQDSTERNLSPSQSQSQSPSHEETKPSNHSRPHRPRKQIHTHHCRFCSHLLLATTRDISLLHRRRDPAQDAAFILPLSSPSGDDGEGSDSESEANGGGKETNYTILLSTLLPDRKHTIIRRVDGFEKRLLLRCGRCRVVIGYFLDNVHFRQRKGQGAADAKGDGGREEGEKKGDDEAKVVYLLPGSLVRTEQLDVNAEDVELKLESDREWRAWLKGER